MANPMSNEKELYEIIKKQDAPIPEAFWKLIDHHLGNDLYAISLICASHVTGEQKEPIPVEDGAKIIEHVDEIRKFMCRIRVAAEAGKKDT